MRHLQYFIIAMMLSLTACLSASAQKSEELQNAYNYKRAVELLSSETPDESGAMDYLP